MKPEKFQNDAQTVAKFIKIYCDDKHVTPKISKTYQLHYGGKIFTPLQVELCRVCHETLGYSIARLKACPHEEKPSCRKCPNPCYEKPQWKLLARIMRHSGMKLGLVKLRSLFKRT
jgi:hypothetical protein